MFATAPACLIGMSLTISGPGMSAQHYYYKDIPSKVTVEVPSGKARQLSLEVYVNPALPTAALAFRGEQTIDLKPGESKPVNLRMIVSETKLLIPDNQGYRLVQVDNMKGDGWIERTVTDLPGIGAFYPIDVDFDASGRIYVANWAGALKLIRLDNISNFAFDTIIGATDINITSIVTLTVDRPRDYLYYADNNTLKRYNIKNNNIDEITLPGGILEIYQITVDKEGLLYISYRSSITYNYYISKFDPSSSPPYFSKTYSSANFFGKDILLRDNYVLVSNPSGAADFKLVKLDTNLNFIKGYGSGALTSENDLRNGYFYNPYQFVAVSRRKIYLIDDGMGVYANGAEYSDRILAMDDLESWNGWDILSGTGAKHFWFAAC
jgi:hypothetical protein